jgi:hypothetical protein
MASFRIVDAVDDSKTSHVEELSISNHASKRLACMCVRLGSFGTHLSPYFSVSNLRKYHIGHVGSERSAAIENTQHVGGAQKWGLHVAT